MALPNDASVVEILQEAVKLKSKKDKVALLSQYTNRKDMMYIMKGVYDSNIEWLLPKGELPKETNYNNVSGPDLADDRLIRVYKNLRYLVKGGADNMSPSKREKVFLDMIESLWVEEAKLLVSVKDKKLPYKLTQEVLHEAYPEWVPAKKKSRSGSVSK